MKDIIGEQNSSTGLGSFHFLHVNVQWEKHIVWWLESFNLVWQFTYYCKHSNITKCSCSPRHLAGIKKKKKKTTILYSSIGPKPMYRNGFYDSEVVCFHINSFRRYPVQYLLSTQIIIVNAFD